MPNTEIIDHFELDVSTDQITWSTVNHSISAAARAIDEPLPAGINYWRLIGVTNLGNQFPYNIVSTQAASAGLKMLKVLRKREFIYRSNGELWYNRPRWYYLELRMRHKFVSQAGKGRKKRTITTFAPAIQIREATPVFAISESVSPWVQETFRTDVGVGGGLTEGKVFSDTETTQSIYWDYIGEPSYRSFTVRVESIDPVAAKAVVSVTYT